MEDTSDLQRAAKSFISNLSTTTLLQILKETKSNDELLQIVTELTSHLSLNAPPANNLIKKRRVDVILDQPEVIQKPITTKPSNLQQPTSWKVFQWDQSHQLVEIHKDDAPLKIARNALYWFEICAKHSLNQGRELRIFYKDQEDRDWKPFEFTLGHHLSLLKFGEPPHPQTDNFDFFQEALRPEENHYHYKFGIKIMDEKGSRWGSKQNRHYAFQLQQDVCILFRLIAKNQNVKITHTQWTCSTQSPENQLQPNHLIPIKQPHNNNNIIHNIPEPSSSEDVIAQYNEYQQAKDVLNDVSVTLAPVNDNSNWNLFHGLQSWLLGHPDNQNINIENFVNLDFPLDQQ